MEDVDDVDDSWMSVARQARECCAHMGYKFDAHCLPDEPHALTCGMSYSAHALTYLVWLRAVCNHQIAHLNPPPELMLHLMNQAKANLERHCQDL